MSNLRIIGILISIVGLFLTFRIFRGPRWNKFNFFLSLLFSISIFLVSLNPNILNVLRDLLALKDAERARILILLIGSNIVLWFLFIMNRVSYDRHKFQFDKLVRKLGEEEASSIISDEEFRKSEIAILIPAYNEASNLDFLLPEIYSNMSDQKIAVLIIDDGSIDNTQSIVNKHGDWLVKNKINRGGGAALRLGYDIISNARIPICVTMDADGQHRSQDILKLIEPIQNGESDFVIGSRLLGNKEKDSRIRSIGIHIFNFVINTLLGTNITDCSSGFRAFRTDIISEISLWEDQYHTSELIIDAVKKGFRINERPITVLKRKYGKSKKGKDFFYGLNFAKAIIRTWWR